MAPPTATAITVFIVPAPSKPHTRREAGKQKAARSAAFEQTPTADASR
jgi:hypothetical protein